MLINARADVNIQNKFGKAPLYKAVLYNNAKVIQMLINAGADANIQNKNGETAEQIVDTHEIRDLFEQDRRKVQNTEAAGNLINLGANLNHETTEDKFAKIFRENRNNNVDVTPLLHKAVTSEVPININIKDDQGNTWLYNSIENCFENHAKSLIAEGVDVNIHNNKGNTPLHRAVLSDCEGIVQPLVNAGANVNSQNEAGDTPLHYAALLKRDNIALQLINAGADVNIQDKQGNTPLHNTTLSESNNIAQQLIDAGANLNIQDANGETPEQVAYTPEMRAIFAQARKK
jgi:ankyrin repeat protein